VKGDGLVYDFNLLMFQISVS